MEDTTISCTARIFALLPTTYGTREARATPHYTPHPYTPTCLRTTHTRTPGLPTHHPHHPTLRGAACCFSAILLPPFWRPCCDYHLRYSLYCCRIHLSLCIVFSSCSVVAIRLVWMFGGGTSPFIPLPVVDGRVVYTVLVVVIEPAAFRHLSHHSLLL